MVHWQTDKENKTTSHGLVVHGFVVDPHPLSQLTLMSTKKMDETIRRGSIKCCDCCKNTKLLQLNTYSGVEISKLIIYQSYIFGNSVTEWVPKYNVIVWQFESSKFWANTLFRKTWSWFSFDIYMPEHMINWHRFFSVQANGIWYMENFITYQIVWLFI